MSVSATAPGPEPTGGRQGTHIMASIKHYKCPKLAMSIIHDPRSTTGSSAERSPRRAAQLLLLPAAQARRASCCAASKMQPTLQLVDCSSILEGSAHTSHVSRAPCSQHMCQVRFQVSRRCGGVRRGKADVRAHGGAKAARWGCVLWMLVLAVASARRLPHQMCTLRNIYFCLS